jgi:hypothetical protein
MIKKQSRQWLCFEGGEIFLFGQVHIKSSAFQLSFNSRLNRSSTINSASAISQPAALREMVFGGMLTPVGYRAPTASVF